MTDRIKIVMSIIASDDDDCCNLDLGTLKLNGSVEAYFPFRDPDEANRLQREWLNWRVQPWEQPFDDIRKYFGEKIGLYFVFIGHYTTWLLPLALVGILVAIDIVVEAIVFNSFGDAIGNGYFVPFYCVFVAFWAQFMLEFWKRKESTKAMEW